MTWNDLIADALLETGSYSPGDPVEAAVQTIAQQRLNRLIDQWSALRRFAYNVDFTAYTLTANLQPHTIGPSGATFATPGGAVRPVRIESASLILNTSTPNVDLPLNIRDDAWWANQQVKPLTSTVPTDLYYSPDFPKGAIYLWPIPTYAYGIRLEMWTAIGVISNFTTTFTAPPGYEQALVLSLAENLCRALGRPAMPDLMAAAAKARRDLETNNISSPRIASADIGAGGGNGRSGFNWRSGGPA